MTDKDKLFPGRIKSQCLAIRNDLSRDIRDLERISDSVGDFVGDTQIVSESFDQMKLQFENYLKIAAMMTNAYDRCIMYCSRLENSVGDENLIGSVILTNKVKYKKLSDDAYAKAKSYASRAAYAFLVPALAALFLALAAYYKSLGDKYYNLYLYWYGKEKKFDAIQAATMSLFIDIPSLIEKIKELLDELINSFVLGQGYNPSVNSQTTLDDEDTDASISTVDTTPEYTGDMTQYIIQGMRNMGYSDEAIAAALGAFVAESGLNPSTTQGHAMDGMSNDDVRAWQGGASGRAIGFAQWDGSRATALLDAADAAGVAWDDPEFQMNYYFQDLARNGYGVDSANSHATDIEHAAFWFTHQFERCGISKDTPGYNYPDKYAASQISYEEREYINGWPTRLSAAQNFYDTYFDD